MTRIVSRIVNFGLLALSLAYGGGARAEDAVDPLDWPYWRGLRMDGVSLEKNLPESWDPAGGPGSNLLWKREIGSRSTPVVMSGKLYLVCNNNPEIPEKEGEKVVCLDAVTGEVRWETPFNVYLSEVPHERVGWSSVVADPASGNVFVQGVCGLFLCLQGDTGKILWSHSMHEEYGLVTTYGGRTNFPIVFEDLAIISGIVCVAYGK